MRIEDLDTRWHELTEELITGMKEWRLQHPQATFYEIEGAVDDRLALVRARMLEDAAVLSRAAEAKTEGTEAPLLCPDCGIPLHALGKQRRDLVTQHDQAIHLERQYAVCPRCGKCFFPLVEELQLLPGHLTPSLQEHVVELSTWMPYARAAAEFSGLPKFPSRSSSCGNSAKRPRRLLSLCKRWKSNC